MLRKLLLTFLIFSYGCLSEESAPLRPADCETPKISRYRIVKVDVALGGEIEFFDFDDDRRGDNAGYEMVYTLLNSFGTARDNLQASVDRAIEQGDFEFTVAQCTDGGKSLFFGTSQQPSVWSPREQDFRHGFSKFPSAMFVDVFGQRQYEADNISDMRFRFSYTPKFDENQLFGVFGGLIRKDTRDEVLLSHLPTLASYLTDRLNAGTLDYLNDIDTDEDGAVQESEVASHPWIKSVYSADVIAKDPSQPDADEFFLSFAFPFVAEKIVDR